MRGIDKQNHQEQIFHTNSEGAKWELPSGEKFPNKPLDPHTRAFPMINIGTFWEESLSAGDYITAKGVISDGRIPREDELRSIIEDSYTTAWLQRVAPYRPNFCGPASNILSLELEMEGINHYHVSNPQYLPGWVIDSIELRYAKRNFPENGYDQENYDRSKYLARRNSNYSHLHLRSSVQNNGSEPEEIYIDPTIAQFFTSTGDLNKNNEMGVSNSRQNSNGEFLFTPTFVDENGVAHDRQRGIFIGTRDQLVDAFHKNLDRLYPHQSWWKYNLENLSDNERKKRAEEIVMSVYGPEKMPPTVDVINKSRENIEAFGIEEIIRNFKAYPKEYAYVALSAPRYTDNLYNINKLNDEQSEIDLLYTDVPTLRSR